jgi:hypothetical protein
LATTIMTSGVPGPVPNPWFQRLVAGLLLLAALAAWSLPAMDGFAEAQVEAGLKRALVAYAMARALNGVISVAQSTEVAAQPAGVGVAVNPGEILDPVNDLVEQFSTVMLFAAASLGLQRLMVVISAWQPLQLVLCALMIGWLVASFFTVPRVQRLLRGFALIAMLLRFAVPVSAVASEYAYRLFLAPEYETSRAAIAQVRDELMLKAEPAPAAPPPDASIADRARAWFQDKADALDVQKQMDALEATATEVTTHVINLIAVFTIQTIVIPLLLLWLGWRALLVVVPRALGR